MYVSLYNPTDLAVKYITIERVDNLSFSANYNAIVLDEIPELTESIDVGTFGSQHIVTINGISFIRQSGSNQTCAIRDSTFALIQFNPTNQLYSWLHSFSRRLGVMFTNTTTPEPQKLYIHPNFDNLTNARTFEIRTTAFSFSTTHTEPMQVSFSISAKIIKEVI